jgi:hypothetical protein
VAKMTGGRPAKTETTGRSHSATAVTAFAHRCRKHVLLDDRTAIAPVVPAGMSVCRRCGILFLTLCCQCMTEFDPHGRVRGDQDLL